MKIDQSKCIKCGTCLSRCPLQAISLVEGEYKIDTLKCVGCGSCAVWCPAEAIS